MDGAGRQDAETVAERGPDDRADSQDAEPGAVPVTQSARQSHTRTWAVVRYVEFPIKSPYVPGREDSNLKISSWSGISTNQRRPTIPNFGTAADLNFRQESDWTGGKKCEQLGTSSE